MTIQFNSKTFHTSIEASICRFGTLHELYSDHVLLGRKSFHVVPPDSSDVGDQHFIARFEPADMQTLNDAWFPIGGNRFPFASDDFGNYFYVELGTGPEDAPVFYVDHDGGDVSPVANSLAAFLKWKTADAAH